MPTYKMDELRKEFGDNATVMRPSHTEINQGAKVTMGEMRSRPLHETKTLILRCCELMERPTSVLEICTFLDRRPTPHLRSILREMSAAGELVESNDIAPNGMMIRYWYSLPTEDNAK